MAGVPSRIDDLRRALGACMAGFIGSGDLFSKSLTRDVVGGIGVRSSRSGLLDTRLTAALFGDGDEAPVFGNDLLSVLTVFPLR